MGLFDRFSRKPGRFVSEEAFGVNRDKQVKMTPLTLEQLRKIGVTEDRELKLEYFFYTNASAAGLFVSAWIVLYVMF